jgi:hypothetical protein
LKIYERYIDFKGKSIGMEKGHANKGETGSKEVLRKTGIG